MVERGDFERAGRFLDEPATKEGYGERNALLWDLERGAVALWLHDYDGTVEHLEAAERRMEAARERSLADGFSQWILNDASTDYIAEPYEDMYVNVLKLLAQLGAGRVQGGATVEARRLATKANMLRDIHLKRVEAVRERGADAGPYAGRGSLALTNPDIEFVESPLGTYLSAVAFMKSGNPEHQRVAARRLEEAISLQRTLVGEVRPADFEGLGERAPESVSVLVVALSGRGPTRVAERHGPVPLGTFPLYFELPVLRSNPGDVTAVRVEVEGWGEAELALVEDLNAVAAENHRRQLPLIRARTIARSLAKAGVSATLTEMARRSVRDSQQGLVQVGGAILGLIAVVATERADLRAWISLPGRAHAGVLDLPPGEHRLRVEFRSASRGISRMSAWRSVRVEPGALATVIEHERETGTSPGRSARAAGGAGGTP
jgi:hypothetical protein